MASGDRNYDIATETTQGVIKALLEEIKEALGNSSSGVVKHIQRGKIKFDDGSTTKSISLSGFSDVKKMIVLLNGSDYFSSSSNDMSQSYDYYLDTLTVSTLTVSRYSSGDIREREGSYQVIEFY